MHEVLLRAELAGVGGREEVFLFISWFHDLCQGLPFKEFSRIAELTFSS